MKNLNSSFIKFITKITSFFFLVLASASPAFAQIRNPAIGELGEGATADNSGSIFATYFISIWRAIIMIGGIMVVVFLIWGAVEWISAGGDSSKIQKARDRIIQAIIGMIVLAGSFTIIGFVNSTFFGGDFNILQLTF